MQKETGGVKLEKIINTLTNKSVSQIVSDLTTYPREVFDACRNF